MKLVNNTDNISAITPTPKQIYTLSPLNNLNAVIKYSEKNTFKAITIAVNNMNIFTAPNLYAKNINEFNARLHTDVITKTIGIYDNNEPFVNIPILS